MRRYVCTVENGRTVPIDVRRILVPVDFSEVSSAALDYAVDLAARFGARVDALHVWNLPPYPAMGYVHGDDDAQSMPTLAQHVQRLAAERLEEMLADRRRDGAEVSGILESGDPIDVIPALAKDYDLVVMGGHDDDPGLAGLLFGNIADRVAGDVDCPVISVRVADEHEELPRASNG